MLALSLLEDWYIKALDVKTTFLYGKLDKEIYMHQPEGFKLKGQEYKVLVKRAKKTFMDICKCRDLGEAREFLRMKIQHEGKKIFLDQADYLKTVVARFGISNA